MPLSLCRSLSPDTVNRRVVSGIVTIWENAVNVGNRPGGDNAAFAEFLACSGGTAAAVLSFTSNFVAVLLIGYKTW